MKNKNHDITLLNAIKYVLLCFIHARVLNV